MDLPIAPIAVVVLFLALLFASGTGSEVTVQTNFTTNFTDFQHDQLSDVGVTPIDNKHLFNDIEQGGAVVRSPTSRQYIKPAGDFQALVLNQTTAPSPTNDIFSVFTQEGIERLAIDSAGLTVIRDLAVSQSASLQNGLMVTGAATITETLVVGTDLSVGQFLTVGNNVIGSNNLIIAQNITADGYLTILLNATLGNLTVLNNTQINRNLFVVNNATVGNLTVRNDAFILDDLNVSDDLLVNSDITAIGTLFSNIIQNTGSIIATGIITFTGSPITLGDSSTDLLNINARTTVSDGFNPLTDYGTALGNTTARFNITRPAIQVGINNAGSGLKHARGSCAITQGLTQDCTITLTGSFADTSYTAICGVDDPTDADLDNLDYEGVKTKNVNSIVVRIQNNDVLNTRTVTIDCIAIHD